MDRPEPGAPDQGANHDDAVWRDLVARLEGDSPAGTPDTARQPDAASGPPAPARPASFRDFDPLGLAGQAPTEPSAAERRAAAAAEREAVPAAAPSIGPRDYEVDGDEGGFVPEDPPSLAGTEPLTMLAWLAAVGGPIALLISAMFWRSAPLLAVVGIVAVFVLGTVYLIMQLPQEKDEDDDGARV